MRCFRYNETVRLKIIQLGETKVWLKKTIETVRGTFEYFVCGQGEPMAITHLYSQYDERGNAFANPFTKYFTVYLINLRGVGNSDVAVDQSQYSMVETVKDLEAMREAFGFEQWAFGGHSTGGMLALQYSIQTPESLTKMVACCTAASYEYAISEQCIYSEKNPNFHRVMEIMNMLSNPETPIEQRKKLGYEWELLSFYREEKLIEALKKPNSGKTVGARLTYFRQVEYRKMDFREQLKHIKVPSYILAGRHDTQCPVQFGIEIAELIPNAHFKIFEESNHFPFLEEEDAFDEFVLDFIEN